MALGADRGRQVVRIPPDVRPGERRPEPPRVTRRYYGMDTLDDTVRSILALAATYKPGTIIKAEQVVDAYLDEFRGYRARRAAMDALLRELASPERQARNRGGLFELIELHLKRRHREFAHLFQ
jgi:hypothetical protein